jgi:hypothetical protein
MQIGFAATIRADDDGQAAQWKRDFAQGAIPGDCKFGKHISVMLRGIP